jgi:hypothetical protein
MMAVKVNEFGSDYLRRNEVWVFDRPRRENPRRKIFYLVIVGTL